jgi:hypothetical protein
MHKFRTPSGRELNNPAKVFRYTFKKQNIWTDSIAPVIEDDLFILNYLRNNHLMDVTQEHTKTVDIAFPSDSESSFAYICVYNYGNWYPIY